MTTISAIILKYALELTTLGVSALIRHFEKKTIVKNYEDKINNILMTNSQQ